MKQDFNEVFKVRKIEKDEEEFYMITIGDRLASWEEFKTEKAAQMKINKTEAETPGALARSTMDTQEAEIRKQWNHVS